MKRINPATGICFRRGDRREDGFVFFAYTNLVKSNGTFKEIWLRPEVSERVMVKDRENKRRRYSGRSV